VEYLKEGQVIDGVVVSVDRSGAEVELGRGSFGILKADDMSWQRVEDPRDLLKVGQRVKVKITKIDSETFETWVGIKQLLPDPRTKFRIGSRVKARVIGITDRGATMDLGGSHGLLPASEMSWTNKHPNEIVARREEIQVEILDVGLVDRSILLSLKRMLPNPWNAFARKHPPGSDICGIVRHKSKSGLLLDLGDDLPGVISLRDLDWYRSLKRVPGKYKIGDTVQARILDIDAASGQTWLGIKQIQAEAFAKLRVDSLVEGRVTKIAGASAVADLNGIRGRLQDSDITWLQLARPIDELKVGQRVQAKIKRIDRKKREVSLGLKQLQDDPLLKLQVGARVKARVTHVFDDRGYAVVNLGGVFAWLYAQELSWTRRDANPSEIVSLQQEIDVRILVVDPRTRLVRVSLKQAAPNPWEEFAKQHPRGDAVRGVIQSKNEAGLLIGLGSELPGTVGVADLDWYRPAAEVIRECRIGEEVRARVLDVDVEKQRIALGMLSTLSAERRRLWVLLRAWARDLARQEEARRPIGSPKVLTVMPTKSLTLTPPVEQGVVRQSFSHGRTKAVVVEKVTRRFVGASREAGSDTPPPRATLISPVLPNEEQDIGVGTERPTHTR
jgi:ribosomal protein S1